MSMDSVYGSILSAMKSLPAGEFKQTCLRVLDEVRDTGEIVVITKRGVPVAQLAPVPRSELADWSGALRGTGEILGDLVSPSLEPDEWDALKG